MQPPLDPLAHWPIDVAESSAGFYLWHAEGAAMVVQFVASEIGKPAMERLVEIIDAARAARAQEVTSHGGMLVLHDWRRVEAVSADAAELMQDAWRENLSPGDIRAVHVAFNPTLERIFHSTNLVAALNTGITIRPVQDVGVAMAELQLRPLAAGAGEIRPR